MDMKNRILTLTAAVILLFFGCTQSFTASSQERVGNIVEFDRMTHDFGDVMLSDGPLHCTFSMKNISGKPVVIYNVVTSCGCTDVQWTKEPIMPGESGTISSTYTNDEGPYPFDKSLTAYISGINNPVILRLRGVSHEKAMSLEEMYPVHFGSLGMKSSGLKCGNLEQGMQKSDEVTIANLSGTPANISFSGVTPGLELNVTPNPIPPQETARLQFTVTADRALWGKNCSIFIYQGKLQFTDQRAEECRFKAHVHRKHIYFRQSQGRDRSQGQIYFQEYREGGFHGI